MLQLRNIHIDDIGEVIKWSKNKLFCVANDWDIGRDAKELQKWWNYCCTDLQSDSFQRLGISLDDKIIGYADFADITSYSAEIGIAIGDSELWGKGYGTNVLQLMLAHGKAKLGITNVFAETHETNFRAKGMLENVGFKEIGRDGREFYMGEDTVLIQYAFFIDARHPNNSELYRCLWLTPLKWTVSGYRNYTSY